MAAAFIDSDYIDAFIGADVRQGLFTTTTVAYSSTHLGVVIGAASDFVKSCAWQAGYTTVGDSTSDGTLKLATLAEFIKMAPGTRKGIAVAQKMVDNYGGYAEAIRSGQMPLLAYTPTTVGGRGGHDATDASSGATYEPKLSLEKTGGY